MPRGLKFILFIAILAGAGYYAYGHLMAPAGGGAMGGAAPVSVAEVIERDVQQWHEFSGRLVAVDSAEIRPQVSGILEKIHFDDGQWVKKGQMLFTIDPRPYQAALESAEAHAAFTSAEFARAKSLIADKAIPQRDFDQRKNDAAVASADLTRARLDYDYTQIKAPFAGRISRAEITAGNLVNAGSGAPLLATVVADKPIYADFDVDEQSFLQHFQGVGGDAAKLKSIPVSVGLAGEDPTAHGGHVQSFDNQLDARSGTLRVRAIFDNEDGALIPGLFARVRLGSAGETKAILISDRAIGTDQNKKFVLVVGDDNKAGHREVTLGGLADGLRIVTGGLKPGEKIIVSGLQRVMMPGQPVTPEVVPMEQGSEAGGQGSGEQKKEATDKEQKPEGGEK